MDRQAELQFREFFEARGHALSRSAFFLTGDHQLAEELLQEALTRTLTRTLVRWQHVAAGGNPEAYVRRVMLNEVRSRWRRRRRFVEELRPDPPETAHVSAMDDGTIDRTDLGAALRALGARQRAVLYLRYYEDRSEAARLLGCTVGTVKSQTHDALARLRVLAPELLSAPDAAEVTE